MDKNQKKSVLAILATFAVVIIVLVLLIPVEQKNQKYNKFGRLAEAAETDERADYIIEHYDEYPEYITKLFYNNSDDEETLDFVYNYAFNKDNYTQMSFTEDELNAEGVPELYMFDKRWAYEKISDDGAIVKTDGCAYTCLTMAYIGLTGNGDIDPVILANYAKAAGLMGGISAGLKTSDIGTVCEALGLNAEYYNYDSDEGGTPIESADEISVLLGEGKVLITAMYGETFGSHAIIIKSCDGGSIGINDPASAENTAQVWNFENIKSEIMGIWVVSNK